MTLSASASLAWGIPLPDEAESKFVLLHVRGHPGGCPRGVLVLLTHSLNPGGAAFQVYAGSQTRPELYIPAEFGVPMVVPFPPAPPRRSPKNRESAHQSKPPASFEMPCLGKGYVLNQLRI